MKGVYQAYPFTLGNMGGDFNSDWFDCRYVTLYSVFLSIAADAGTAGEFFLEGTPELFSGIPGPVTRFANADMDWWLDGAAGGSPVVGAAAAKLELFVKSPKPYHRIAFVGAGGIADQVRVYQWGRSGG